MKCRHCNTELTLTLIDLGGAPPSNAYLTEKTLCTPEKWFPLRVLICEKCWLVQTEDFTQADELFNEEYAYFSSFSTSWLQHAENYVKNMIERFSLNEKSHVIEVAANDGYLLQYVKEHNIPCMGIEPTSSTAIAARKKGITIVEEFFGVSLAKKLVKQGRQADLTTANNVLAHVPDINDFVAGFSIVLKTSGVATFEFPHLIRLINESQFDTIYHEHFSYLSLTALGGVFEKNGLQIFDVEECSTHGGSLRIFAQRSDTGVLKVGKNVERLVKYEKELKVDTSGYYIDFQKKANKIKDNFLKFLIDKKNKGESVAAYGAAAKGNTLLNYAGVKKDLIPYVVDKNINKQGKYMPGSRIPIKDEQYLIDNKPEYIIIFPWNIVNEIIEQLQFAREWGVKVVVFIPEIKIL